MKTKSILVSRSLLFGLLAAGLGTPAPAQDNSDFYRPLTLASNTVDSGGGGAAVDDEQAKSAALAKKLQNPVAALISMPIQNNWDFGIGSANAMKYTANVQPVIPITLNEDWNVISRTILPIIYAESPVKGGRDAWGLGDTLQSLFFSPKEPTRGGWIWGAGPALLLPTATDSMLGLDKWAAGPTAVLLKQKSGFTYGALANQLFDFAGSGDARINATYLQPFASFTTKTFTTFGVSTESTYDWDHSQWTVPLVGTMSQLLKVGKQPIQLSLAAKYYADKPTGGPDWGLRFMVTFLFPK